MNCNVVLISIDSLRKDCLGFLNPTFRLTPFLDSLARRSIVFSDAYSAGGGTIYAMAGLMTSSYPIITPEDRTINNWPTIAVGFKRMGYRTAAFHSNPWLSELFGFDEGFDKFHYIAPQLPVEDVVNVGTLAQRIPIALGELVDLTIRDDPICLRAHQLFDLAIDWIRSLGKEEHFFLWVHPMDVHFPYSYPSSTRDRLRPSRILGYGFNFLSRYSGKRIFRSIGSKFSLIEEYRHSIRYLDSALKHFFELLPTNTMVVLLSDHGELFGEHGYFQHPGLLYNEIIRVPILIYKPGMRGRIVNEPFCTTELTRVIFELLSNDVLHTAFTRKPLSIHVDYNKKIRRTSIIDSNWKLLITEYLTRKIVEQALFNLSTDPNEQCNLLLDQKEIASHLFSLQRMILRSAEIDRYKSSAQQISIISRKTI
jgi:arylsulfatase A-like enzyme